MGADDTVRHPASEPTRRAEELSFAMKLFVAAARGTVDAMTSEQHYQAPGWFTRNVFNKLVLVLTRLGLSFWGSRILEVRGRKSGQPRRTPVNLLTHQGKQYLVAPRGHTQWVRNLRAAGEGDLLLGRRRDHFLSVEVADVDKEPILRAYLRRWKWEVGQFFGGVGPDSPATDITRIAPNHPVFRVQSIQT
jgi:deazaflavin-dependent oxidoreductase (nitroreductase family)